MASAKATTTVGRSSPSKGAKRGNDTDISPARWGGVVLVIAAIVGAILLAIVSPSEPGAEAQPGQIATDASAVPVSSGLDTRVPTAQPRILDPIDTVTRELDITVTVDLPDEELARESLKLVILRGEQVLKEKPKPKTGGKVTVKGVRIDPGQNSLTAALRGPGGLGPLSEPVTVTSDQDAPMLAITSPEHRSETLEAAFVVEGTSEVGATVEVMNETNGSAHEEVVNEGGEFDITIPLEKGPNVIVATSVDTAGQEQKERVRITRLDTKPKVEVKVAKQVKKSKLPTDINVVVIVTDAAGKKMADAEVFYSLGGPGRNAVVESARTNESGRSTWTPRIELSTSPADAVELAVRVTSPRGDSTTVDRKIELK